MEKLLWHTAPYGSTLTGLHYWPDIPIVHSLDISWGEAINRLKEKLRYSLEASVFQKLFFVGNTLNLQFWFLASHRVLFPCWILQLLPWSQHIPSETWYYNSAKPSCYSSYWDLQIIQAESKTPYVTMQKGELERTQLNLCTLWTWSVCCKRGLDLKMQRELFCTRTGLGSRGYYLGTCLSMCWCNLGVFSCINKCMPYWDDV